MSKDSQRSAEDESLHRFVALAFRSVWSVELLMLLRSKPDEDWSREQMIGSLRASENVLSRSIEDLRGAGLVRAEDGLVRYSPDTPVIDETVAEVIKLYTSRPATVRRLIVSGGSDDQLTRFADAFRVRGDNK